MGNEVARRVRDGLAELIRLVNDPDTPTADVRDVLNEAKALGAQMCVLQADAAVVVAARERHGDSGAGVLAQAAGLSRRDAAGQVETARRLQSMPAVRDAVKAGQVSIANARTLARASGKTSAALVDSDADLLTKAADLSPDQFIREANRWTVKRQEDGGEGEYRRQRARRRLSFWDGDDGMVHLRAELDPVTGAKVRKRFVQEAERLRRSDLRSPGEQERSLDQRMADALDTLTSHGSIYSKAESASSAGSAGSAGSRADRVGADTASGCGCGGRSLAEITIVQHLSADGTEAFAEVAGGGMIPPSVLEEHFCNARIKGVVFSGEGLPLWHSHTKRLATKAQMSALRALYGACGGCGADMWTCQGHHIRPVSEGGATNIDNMMLLCWACHQKVHHHGWREVPDGRGLYTIAPPERIRYGPAHASDPTPGHRDPPPRASKRSGAGAEGRLVPVRTGVIAGSPTEAPQPEPLFALA
jgi:hypothetical protein